MMKSEFEERVHKMISDADYEIIEYVYTWYPSISDVDGKNQIAYLYTTFGMRIIIDMLPTAKTAQKLYENLCAANNARNKAKDAYESFKMGIDVEI